MACTNVAQRRVICLSNLFCVALWTCYLDSILCGYIAERNSCITQAGGHFAPPGITLQPWVFDKSLRTKQIPTPWSRQVVNLPSLPTHDNDGPSAVRAFTGGRPLPRARSMLHITLGLLRPEGDGQGESTQISEPLSASLTDSSRSFTCFPCVVAFSASYA